MSLQSLVFCSDEKVVRLLRRILNDLEITVEHCADANSAILKLTRQRFEALIVDCDDAEIAAQVLKSARSAPCNKRAVAVAIIDNKKTLHNAFDLGAHFLLYKPISAERAKSSFRAARALMKCERRRNNRVAVELPVTLVLDGGASNLRTVTQDVSVGGFAIQLSPNRGKATNLRVQFVLPETEYQFDCAAEVAWENSERQAGIRFMDISAENSAQLNAWIDRHSPEAEIPDPPVSCKITDLSPGGCYLELQSPFPVGSRIVVSIAERVPVVRAPGLVRVMHPDFGMGLEFIAKTSVQQDQVQNFIRALRESNGAAPIQVETEGLATEESQPNLVDYRGNKDPLLQLFHYKAGLLPEAFLSELRGQRGSNARSAATVSGS